MIVGCIPEFLPRQGLQAGDLDLGKVVDGDDVLGRFQLIRRCFLPVLCSGGWLDFRELGIGDVEFRQPYAKRCPEPCSSALDVELERHRDSGVGLRVGVM